MCFYGESILLPAHTTSFEKGLNWFPRAMSAFPNPSCLFGTLKLVHLVQLLSIQSRKNILFYIFTNIQLSSVSQSCLTLCDPMNWSTPGLPVHHQLPESTQTQIHWVGDAIQPSHPLSSTSPAAPNPSQHQGLFKWVSSSHQVTKLLELQLQNHSYQLTPRIDLL